MSEKETKNAAAEKTHDLSGEDSDWAAHETPTVDVEPTTGGNITPENRLFLAQKILIGVALIFVLSMCLAVFYPPNGEKIFDVCKTILPPIATLVIGYYFSREN